MVDGGIFNINNQTRPTNKDLLVTFSPSTNTNHYSYIIYKDGKFFKQIDVPNNKASNINLTETGSYQISAISYDSLGNSKTDNSGIYIIDKEAPIIRAENNYAEVYKNDGDLISEIGLTATDNYDGDITKSIQGDEINYAKSGVREVTYTVSDLAGNTASKTIDVNVIGNMNSLFSIQILAITILIIILIPVIRLAKSVNTLKRLDPFVLTPSKSDSVSIFDRLFNIYHQICLALIIIFNKSHFAKKYAKKLDKYKRVSAIHNSGMEILAGKFIIALFFLFIVLSAMAISLKKITYYELIIPFLVGFFILDILYFIKYKVYHTKLENDFLSAIIVMNNAFKSGRSISQAIDIAGNEIEGEIGKEFKKMSLELSYGLEIDVIFKRFSERINLEEVNYLTASLSILNKTGGNIIEVFSSIEKTLFSKKKLRIEFKSLTGSSKLIVLVLIFVPLLFVLCISLINPSYFMPFITSKLGNALLGFMIIYYIIFIICIRKIMKVVI